MTHPSPAPSRRLPADDRRRQLVGIGLRLLTQRPIHDVSLDEVAAQAGISRGLLFHYFPTKRDYYAAVVRAAAGRLLRAVTPEAPVPPEDRLRAILGGYVRFIARRREPYLALVRGTAGGDPLVVEVFDDTRRSLTDLVVAAAPVADDPDTRTFVRAWLAFAEELVLASTGAGTTGQHAEQDGEESLDRLVETLEASLQRLLDPPLTTSTTAVVGDAGSAPTVPPAGRTDRSVP